MTIKAVVFDFDGTLMDTEKYAYEAFCGIYEEYGHKLALEKWALLIGTHNGPFDPYEELSGLTGLALDREELKKKFETGHLALLREAALLPGVKEALEEARARGLKIGLASSSDRSWIETHLNNQGIRHYFETIRSSDDVEKVKPDPALYRMAAADLGVLPEEAVAVEDSRNGMLGALNAGLHAIVVPNAVTRHMDFSEASLVVRTLENQSLAQLIEQVEGRISAI
ncbi:HAD family hydrolase [Cohnella faecalis]|uniref:HAD family hydrolase n=1 Tax=Cohnella faecalis TaxID=2315694 RepID=A0A398CX50_9BACL|nr:HAD-IA family hydrolase [Cohnella faecalis]RIE03574.1 HAD family hydrolase [Cohnella faecalis]